MTQCYIALGSNLNNPASQIDEAILAIRQWPLTRVVAIAPYYRSRAFGQKVAPSFYNTVIAIETRLPPMRLLMYCHQEEKRQKRKRTLRWGKRTIDLDIIFYGNIISKQKNLILPHPRWHERDFVRTPLFEIAPGFQTPNTKETLQTLTGKRFNIRSGVTLESC